MTLEHVNRRSFAKHLILGAATVSLSPHVSRAADDETTNDDGTAEPQDDTKAPDEIELVLRTIVARYPDERLNETALKAIRGEIQYNRFLSEQLNRFQLKNSDQPVPVFAAWRAPSVTANPTQK